MLTTNIHYKALLAEHGCVLLWYELLCSQKQLLLKKNNVWIKPSNN